MVNYKNTFPYIHGFDRQEQDRLYRQARFTEHSIYSQLDFTDTHRLLEVGCGVGAQSEIILRRYPEIKKLTGIDVNDKQLATCREHLRQVSWAKGRYEIKRMDAGNLEFEGKSFDGAFLCWVLEHIKDPNRVLSEIRRVLAPGALIVVNEVMNSSFFLDPYSPNLWQYWMAFNDYQLESGGDPFIGLKLGNLLLSLGLVDINTKIITWHLDNRWPDKRAAYIQELTAILQSASERLLQAKYVTDKVVDKAMEELAKVAKDPNAVYCMSFMQATARV